MTNQLRYNQQAHSQSATVMEEKSYETRFTNVAMKQVVYSFVGYPVGAHKDVSQTGVEKEFIECKALIKFPFRSERRQDSLALGRGGMGRGVYTFMVVDHPKKKT